MGISGSVTETIGRTPLVRLVRLGAGLPGTVLVKLESRNPGGSVKDRIGLEMVLDAERKGRIHAGTSVLVEPTSGNTGVALALVGAARDYRVVLTMPETMSVERRKLLAAYGARLELTPAQEGMLGAVRRAKEIAERVKNAFLVGQFDNPANPKAHYRTTGPEIVKDVGDEPIGAFVAGVGTGGTISGTGRLLKERVPDVRIVAVEPAESPIISQRLSGEPLTPAAHGIQGIGANFIPSVLDLTVLDEALTVSTDEAIAMARRCAAEEGMLVGISSGANIAAAIAVASRPEMKGRLVVTVAPSTGERYLSTALWEGVG